MKAAQRSLDIATIQYREGLTDFQRVLDSQRTLFSQQERLVTTRGSLTQSLIALYKAMGGGWEAGAKPAGAGRRDARDHGPAQRLEGHAGGPAAGARRRRSATRFRNGKTMSQEPASRNLQRRSRRRPLSEPPPTPRRPSPAREPASARSSCWC